MNWFWEEFADFKELFEEKMKIDAVDRVEDFLFLNFIRYKMGLGPLPSCHTSRLFNSKGKGKAHANS